MEVRETVQRSVETVTDVLCDICGQSCKTEYGFESLNMIAHWGFFSNSKDGEAWTAQICEDCVDKHLKPLIKFNIKEY